MSELVRTSSSSSSSDSSLPSPTVIHPPIQWSALLQAKEEVGQKRRGRPRMNDAEVEMDESTSEAEKMRIIYKRKYARNYRQKVSEG
uniref:BZIP domain-containing protein n=1 Tax=Steinernema glaseri TaxID=37863 RepID=A0A1I7ZXD6_9BILA